MKKGIFIFIGVLLVGFFGLLIWNRKRQNANDTTMLADASKATSAITPKASQTPTTVKQQQANSNIPSDIAAPVQQVQDAGYNYF